MTTRDASFGYAGNDAAESTVATIAMGLAAGAIGVWALDRIDWFMWNRESDATRSRTIAARPGGEPPAQALVSRLEDATGRHLTDDRHEAVSQAVHYTIGIGPAVGYALLRDKLPVAGTAGGIARGAAFGLGLFVTQDEVLNTVTGLGGRPTDYPWTAHARGIVAHTVFGVTTELALNLMQAIGRRIGGDDVSGERKRRVAVRARADR